MCMPFDDEREIVVERLLRARGGDVSELDELTQALGDFDVEQVRSVQALYGSQRPRSYAVGTIGAEQKLEECGRIDDDQRPSRSERTTSAGECLPR